MPKDRSDVTSSTANMKDEQKLQLKEKLVQMLKSLIENSRAKQENGVLQQLVEILESPRSDMSQKNLIALFNSVSSEDIDVVKIKEVMLGIKRDQDLLRHKNFGMGNYLETDTSKINADINRDIDNFEKTYNVKNFGIEGSRLGKC